LSDKNKEIKNLKDIVLSLQINKDNNNNEIKNKNENE